MEIQTNVVFKHLEASTKRIIVEQGGTRSGKTYNILIWLVVSYALRNTGKTITLCRKTYPSLRASAMRDFIDILMKLGLYNEDYHNKSNSEITLNGNLVEFIGMDQPQKIRGRKRDVLFANEANELSIEDWRQLSLRTTERIIIDYNPSDEFHWIYDEVITRDDADFYQTTYLDNPFLEDSVIAEIERLKSIDENYWRVYGLGERGQAKSLIFTYNECQQIPTSANLVGYGLDFGYSADPTALIAVYQEGDDLYADELIYRVGMTNSDIYKTIASLNLSKYDPIWGDSAEPKTIDELRRRGLNVKATAKGRDSINIGIDMIRRYRLHVTSRSSNLIKELRNYKYHEDKQGRVTNKPIDAFNHGCDAMRYSIYNTLARPNYGRYSIR
jgi:phage terminase large subunit